MTVTLIETYTNNRKIDFQVYSNKNFERYRVNGPTIISDYNGFVWGLYDRFYGMTWTNAF